jgi:hypothetical protein
MKKKLPRPSASDPQPSPHSTAIAAPSETADTHTGNMAPPAPVVITLSPLTFNVVLPPVTVLTSVRAHMRGLRKIPLSQPQQRVEKMRAVSKSLDALDQEPFRGRVQEAQHALAQNQVEPFLWVVSHFGPRGLARVLTDATALATVEGWWIDQLQSVESEGAHKLTGLVNTLTEGVSGKDREYTAIELTERKRPVNLDSQRTRRARKYYDKAIKQYHAATDGMIDPVVIQNTAMRLADKAFFRHTPAKCQAKEWYWEEVNRDPRLKLPTVSKNTPHL